MEDEYYVQIEHEMSKKHYISFIAAASADGFQMVKLYPQGKAEARFKISDVKKFYFYCNRSGLFEYIRCEMTPTSLGGEQQISISGGRHS